MHANNMKGRHLDIAVYPVVLMMIEIWGNIENSAKIEDMSHYCKRGTVTTYSSTSFTQLEKQNGMEDLPPS